VGGSRNTALLIHTHTEALFCYQLFNYDVHTHRG
jgi:hypothetical protein